MKRAIALLALVAGAAMAAPQTVWTVLPDTVTLEGATTTDNIRSLFFQDSTGMNLISNEYPATRTLRETVLELTGRSPFVPYGMSFTVGAYAYAYGPVSRRIECFNYTTNHWDVIGRTQTVEEPPFARPFTVEPVIVLMKAGMYVQPLTGQVRARVVWTSRSDMPVIWVDVANWTVLDYWHG